MGRTGPKRRVDTSGRVDAMSINPKVGDVLYIGKRNYNGPMKFAECAVAKVGRKFFTVNVGNDRFPVETRFAIGCRDGDDDSDSTETNYRNKVWSSKAAHDAYHDRLAALGELRDMFGPYGLSGCKIPESVTADDVRKAIGILKGQGE